MTDRYSAVLVEKKQRRRLADVIAPADYDCVSTLQLRTASFEELDHSRRCAGYKTGNADCQPAHAYRVKPVDVLVGIYAQDDALLVDMARQRQLHQQAVNILLL